MVTRRSARLSGAAQDLAAKSADQSMPPPAAAPSRKRKADQKATAAQEAAPPATPPRKRRTAKSDVPPPATPTPSAVGLMASPAKRTPKPKREPTTRLADPTGTNAPLLSPETSRIVAPKAVDGARGATSKTTSATILEEACAHLVSVDARMAPLIRAHHCRIFSPEGLAERIDPFESLASGIISQQVSGAAAKAIKRRFVELFHPPPPPSDDPSSSQQQRFPHPSQVAVTSLERLRTAGLSQRKAEYLQGLAEKFTTGELSTQLLADASYEEVLERLIAVRGLGRWSVEMFACFGLKRMDVFSLGDLGVQRGMAAFVGRDVAKLKNKGGKWKYMAEKEMEELAERFRPYRSLFMWYMWRVEETDVSTLE